MRNKLKLLLISVTVLFMASSCQSLFSTSEISVATSAGKSCGKAISTLYKEYRKQNKIDVSNTTTLTSIVEIAAARNLLKENKENKDFVTAFALGLVSGSNNLITSQTSNNVINALLSLSSLGMIATNTPSNSNAANEAGKSLLPLVQSIDK